MIKTKEFASRNSVYRILTAAILVILALALCFLSSGCSKGDDEAEQEPAEEVVEPEVTEEEEPAEEVPEEPEGFFNPLTGEATETDISGNKPYAVMLNNISKALPQSGVASADIIYEVLVEGGYTRLCAFYQDLSDVEILGSVRSMRHYYLDLARAYDAIYVHAGGSYIAYDQIGSTGLTDIDGVNGTGEIFYRDAERKAHMGYEHSLMVEVSRIPAFLEKYKINTAHSAGFVSNLSFTDDATPADGTAAENVKVEYSGIKNTSFEYNAEDKLYYASQNGKDFIDGLDNSRVTVTNIVVIKAATSNIPNDDKGRIDIKLTGTGDGYFICGGKAVPITWSRGDRGDQFTYKLADGSDLVLGVGKTYISIIPTNRDVTFS
ncbi:MAG: DUF3048 domain-containing protein [Oscillospiraceae bacterium]|nr:DUF3048 domain-containing protein [Oscillospiraceae bacterium]